MKKYLAMGKTDRVIDNCFVSENYKQLQKEHSPIFLISG